MKYHTMCLCFCTPSRPMTGKSSFFILLFNSRFKSYTQCALQPRIVQKLLAFALEILEMGSNKKSIKIQQYGFHDPRVTKRVPFRWGQKYCNQLLFPKQKVTGKDGMFFCSTVKSGTVGIPLHYWRKGQLRHLSGAIQQPYSAIQQPYIYRYSTFHNGRYKYIHT
jgi:hypothetical protein